MKIQAIKTDLQVYQDRLDVIDRQLSESFNEDLKDRKQICL